MWSEIRGSPDVEFRSLRISTTVQLQALTILVLGAGIVVLATSALISVTDHRCEKVLLAGSSPGLDAPSG